MMSTHTHARTNQPSTQEQHRPKTSSSRFTVPLILLLLLSVSSIILLTSSILNHAQASNAFYVNKEEKEAGLFNNGTDNTNGDKVEKYGGGGKNGGDGAGSGNTTTNSKWIIVMATYNQPYFSASLNYTKAYANMHGYDILVRKEENFLEDKKDRYKLKLYAIKEAMERGYEYIYWKDTDTVVSQCHVSLDNIFEEENRLRLQRPYVLERYGKQKRLTKEAMLPQDHMVDAVFIGDTHAQLCTGSMWFRNTLWSRKLINRVLEIMNEPRRPPEPWWDQSVFLYVLMGEPSRCREVMGKWNGCFPRRGLCLNGGCENIYMHANNTAHIAIADAQKLARFHIGGNPRIIDSPWSRHASSPLKGENKTLAMQKYFEESTCRKAKEVL